MTPTPRTDALRRDPLDSNDLRAWQSLADTLERELAEADYERELARGGALLVAESQEVSAAAAIESRNAAVRRCIDAINGWAIVDDRHEKMIAEIRAEFPEAWE